MGGLMEDLRRAARATAEREQRGQQMTLGDLESAQGGPGSSPEISAEALPRGPEMAQRGPEGSPETPPFLLQDQQGAGRDYRRTYRAAFDFHRRHAEALPRTPDDWQRILEDMEQTATAGGNDPFLMALLCAIFEEIEHQAGEGRGE